MRRYSLGPHGVQIDGVPIFCDHYMPTHRWQQVRFPRSRSRRIRRKWERDMRNWREVPAARILRFGDWMVTDSLTYAKIVARLDVEVSP